MKVRLPWPVVRAAAHVGVDRRVNRLEDYDGRELWHAPDPWDRDIRGAIAEAAVAFVADVPWPNGNRPDGTGPDSYRGDVCGWEVRSVTSPAHKLGVQRGRDRPDRVHVLVVVQRELLPVVDIAGWIMGSDAMRTRYWNRQQQHPAYMVPAADLNAWPPPWDG